jgi:hypothetical protein
MARRRSSLAVRSFTMPRAAAPIIRIAAPRAIAAPKSRRRRAHAASTGFADPFQLGIAAALVGMAEKSGMLDKLPTVPMLGRKGTIALAAWYWSRHGGGPWVRKVAIVAAVLAGHQLGSEGRVSGDDEGQAVTGDASPDNSFD